MSGEDFPYLDREGLEPTRSTQSTRLRIWWSRPIESVHGSSACSCSSPALWCRCDPPERDQIVRPKAHAGWERRHRRADQGAEDRVAVLLWPAPGQPVALLEPGGHNPAVSSLVVAPGGWGRPRSQPAKT